MKKVLKAALALLLAVAISCVAFADGSKTELVEVTGAVDSNGETVELVQSETAIDLTEEEAAEIAGSFEAADAEILALFELTAPAGTEFPLDVTFQIGDVGSQSVYVYHYNGDEWEIVDSSYSDGAVTATFDSLSPVAIVLVDEDTGDNGEGDDSDDGDSSSDSNSSSNGSSSSSNKGSSSSSSSSSSSKNTGKSPKTGETDSVLYAGAAILVAGAAAFLVSKKRA